MSRLDRPCAYRCIPPERRFQATFGFTRCIEAEHGAIAAEARCLQDACREASLPLKPCRDPRQTRGARSLQSGKDLPFVGNTLQRVRSTVAEFEA